MSSVFQPYLPECGTATGGVCEDLASAVWLPACMQRETTGRSLATTAVTLYSSTSTVLYCSAVQCSVMLFEVACEGVAALAGTIHG